MSESKFAMHIVKVATDYAMSIVSRASCDVDSTTLNGIGQIFRFIVDFDAKDPRPIGTDLMLLLSRIADDVESNKGKRLDPHLVDMLYKQVIDLSTTTYYTCKVKPQCIHRFNKGENYLGLGVLYQQIAVAAYRMLKSYMKAHPSTK